MSMPRTMSLYAIGMIALSGIAVRNAILLIEFLKKALDDPSLNIKVIDVREPDEAEIAKVDGVPMLPLSEVDDRFTELDPNQHYYLHCKGGVRSLKALNFLRENGYKYLKSVKGGIAAWSEEIDPNVPKY